MTTKIENASAATKNAIRAVLLGDRVLTVGAAGMYATVQDAFDYIATQPAFDQVTMVQDGTVSSWNQGSDTIDFPNTAVGTPQTASAEFVQDAANDRLYLKAVGDTRYYPFESISNVQLSAAGSSAGKIRTKMRRFEANASGNPAIEWFTANVFHIILLDNQVSESLLTYGAVAGNIVISGFGRDSTDFQPSFGADSWHSGSICFQDMTVGKAYGIQQIGVFAGNAIKMSLNNVRVASVHDDFMYPNTSIGSLVVDNCLLANQPQSVEGHMFSANTILGDLIVRNCVWNPTSMSTNQFLPATALIVDSCNSVRNVIIQNLTGEIIDQNENFARVSIIGDQCDTGSYVIDGVNMRYKGAGSLEFNAVRIGAAADGMNISLSNISLHAPNSTGTTKLLHKSASPAGNCDILIGRGNTTVRCDIDANLSYTSEYPQFHGENVNSSGTSESTVTHNLGYIPKSTDIRVVHSLLGAAVGWYITNITATQFKVQYSTTGVFVFDWAIGN